MKSVEIEHAIILKSSLSRNLKKKKNITSDWFYLVFLLKKTKKKKTF